MVCSATRQRALTMRENVKKLHSLSYNDSNSLNQIRIKKAKKKTCKNEKLESDYCIKQKGLFLTATSSSSSKLDLKGKVPSLNDTPEIPSDPYFISQGSHLTLY